MPNEEYAHDAKALKDVGVSLSAAEHTVFVHFRGTW